MNFFPVFLFFVCVNLIPKSEANAHLKVVLLDVDKLSETWSSSQLFQSMKADGNQDCCGPEIKAYLQAVDEDGVKSVSMDTGHLSMKSGQQTEINKSLYLETDLSPVAFQLKVFVVTPKCGVGCSVDAAGHPNILDEFSYLFSPIFKTLPNGIITVPGQFSGMSLSIVVTSFATDFNISGNITSETTPASVATTLSKGPCGPFGPTLSASIPKLNLIYKNATIGLGATCVALLFVIVVLGILLYHFVRKHRRDKIALVKDSSSNDSDDSIKKC